MPYPDSLLPVAKDYTMIEAAIVEAAMAGCNTIWVVCNDNISPIIRHRIGDYIQDPIYFYNNNSKFSSTNRRRIPIFWVPIHPKDRDKRDCLSWSVLHGALTSLKVSSQLSKWMTPDKYYVSFPYGIFDPRPLRNYRTKIRSKTNFYVTTNHKSVQDNYFCSFTFGKEEFIKYRKNIRKGTGAYTAEVNDKGMPSKRLPIEQRWSARFFELKQVFTDLTLDNATIYETDEFYNISDWKTYCSFLSTEFASTIKRPNRGLFSYREFNSIAKDIEKY